MALILTPVNAGFAWLEFYMDMESIPQCLCRQREGEEENDYFRVLGKKWAGIFFPSKKKWENDGRTLFLFPFFLPK